jgi:hypothetical protein
MTKTVSETWAEILTDKAVAYHLELLSHNIRYMVGEQRTALLCEAARRLADEDG